MHKRPIDIDAHNSSTVTGDINVALLRDLHNAKDVDALVTLLNQTQQDDDKAVYLDHLQTEKSLFDKFFKTKEDFQEFKDRVILGSDDRINKSKMEALETEFKHTIKK